ncbi:hypothetical protein HY488_02565 [Candidatus Woesearchaeota archaeon]|nr:hypothetical protein [Candidatus Woesearchaeota archaeon]
MEKMDDQQPAPETLQAAPSDTKQQSQTAIAAGECESCPKPVLATEKILITIFVLFIALTILLITMQSKWYYFTFAISLIVLFVTYKEGLVAMEDEE